MTRISETFPTAEEVARHGGFLKRVASRLVGDVNVADELVQETLMAGLRQPPGPPARARAWLRRVCVNAFRARHRAEERRRRREAGAARPEGFPSAAQVAQHRAASRAVVRAVTSLDEPYYSVIVLRYYEGLPPREIAARLGVPVGTVKRRLERGHARLRTHLRAWRPDWRTAVLPLATLPKAGPVTAASAAATAHVAGDVLLGGLVMAKVAMYVVGVVVLCGFAWLMMTGEGSDGVTDAGATTPPPSGSNRSTGSEGATSDPVATQPFAEAAQGGLFDLASVDRDLDLFGVVTDPSGAPVAGARVQTVFFPGKRLSLLGAGGQEKGVQRGLTRTDRNGAFILRHQRGEGVDLVVRAKGFAQKTVTCCQAGGRVDVQLSIAGTVDVVVRDQRDQPVPGATVRFFRSVSSVKFYRTFDTREGVTDQHGRFSVHDVEPGEAKLSIHHESYLPASNVPVEVKAADDETVITLEDGSVLTGRVTDRQTGEPIAGAVITTSWSGTHACRTDARGMYRLAGWHGMRNRQIHAMAAGYGRTAARVESGNRLDLELDRGDVVKGRVHSWSGEPLGNVRVTAIGSQWGENLHHIDSRSGKTAPDGSFLLDGIRRDIPHSLIIQATGHGRHMLDFDSHPGGVIDLGIVTLARAHAIEGVVLGSDGRPVAGAFVRLNGFNKDRLRLRETPAIEATERFGREEGRVTDDLGRFRFPDLSPGPYKLMANQPGLPEVSKELILREGEDPKTVVVRWPAGGRFVVRVREDSGNPIRDLQLLLHWKGLDRSMSKRTDTQGSAVFDGVPEGVELRVHVLIARPYASPKPASLKTRLGPDPFVITLTRARVVAGVVLDPSDKPLPGVALAAYRNGKQLTSTNTDKKGRFKLRFDSAGHTVDVRIWNYISAGPTPVRKLRYQGSLGDILVPSQDLVLRASPVDEDRTLSVNVTTPDGEAAVGSKVRIVAPGIDRTLSTDASGVVFIKKLSSLTTRVVALAPDGSDFADSSSTRVVPNGQSIRLALRAGLLITGTVLGTDGNPAPGARVKATTSTRPGAVVGVADTSGRFSLRVPAGATYTLEASFEDRFGDYKRAILEDVKGRDVVLRLR